MSVTKFKLQEYGGGNEIEVLHYKQGNFYEILIGDDLEKYGFEGLQLTEAQMRILSQKINEMLEENDAN